jgi:hypothetical protein
MLHKTGGVALCVHLCADLVVAATVDAGAVVVGNEPWYDFEDLVTLLFCCLVGQLLFIVVGTAIDFDCTLAVGVLFNAFLYHIFGVLAIGTLFAFDHLRKLVLFLKLLLFLLVGIFVGD